MCDNEIEIKSLPELMEQREILIPIIQRDYAQGRKEPKANNVRNNLINDWIKVLDGIKPPMDFNFIYGTESGSDNGSIFYPVDGQQRLTSLFLLYFLLAHMCSDDNDREKIEKIKAWKFTYQTRNSAKEFFESLKNTGNDIYEVLKKSSKKDTVITEIQNRKWFKDKWKYDPTIVAALNFLTDLYFAIKDKDVKKYWEKLNPTGNNVLPLIRFTYLPERSTDTKAEAAKKYIRMNARGKKLTDFENLKAVIDEIEEQYRINISCSVSKSYDLIYCDTKFSMINCGGNQKLFGNSEELVQKVGIINKDFLNLFRNVFYCCCFRFGMKVPGKQSDVDGILYRISQKDKETIEYQNHIVDYIKYLKAVLDILYPADLSGDRKKFGEEWEQYFIKASSINYRLPIIFMLFAEKFCNDIDLVDGWKRFYDVILDLRIEQLDLEINKEKIDIIDKILADIKNVRVADINASSSARFESSINRYFIKYLSNNNNEWEGVPNSLAQASNEPDIMSRIREQVIKSGLLEKGICTEDDLKEVKNIGIGDKRYGWFFNLLDIDFGSISNINFSNLKVKEYISYLKVFDTWDFQLAFAYASNTYRDQNILKLKSSNDINNSCGKNEHIYYGKYDFTWNDSEAGADKEKTAAEYYDVLRKAPVFSENKKRRNLEILHDMMELVYDYSQNTKSNEPIKEFNKNIWDTEFNTYYYADCWLRVVYKLTFASNVNSNVEINTYLKKVLSNENGIVVVKECDIPFILYVYLDSKKIKFSDKECVFYAIAEPSGMYFRYFKENEFMTIDIREVGGKPDENNNAFIANKTYSYSNRNNSNYDKTFKNNQKLKCDYSNYIKIDLANQSSTMPAGTYVYVFDGSGFSVDRYDLVNPVNNEMQINKTHYSFTFAGVNKAFEWIDIYKKCLEYRAEWNAIWKTIKGEENNGVFRGRATDRILEMRNNKTTQGGGIYGANDTLQAHLTSPAKLNLKNLRLGYSDANSTNKTWIEETYVDYQTNQENPVYF